MIDSNDICDYCIKDGAMCTISSCDEQYSGFVGRGIETASPWISVNERLPEVGVTVFSVRGDMMLRDFIVDGHRWDMDEYDDYPVTHWMPMPEPPKEGE